MGAPYIISTETENNRTLLLGQFVPLSRLICIFPNKPAVNENQRVPSDGQNFSGMPSSLQLAAMRFQMKGPDEIVKFRIRKITGWQWPSSRLILGLRIGGGAILRSLNIRAFRFDLTA